MNFSISFSEKKYVLGWQSENLFYTLTQGGWVTHIRVSKLTIIGSDNGVWLAWRQAIIPTNAGILLIRPLGINLCDTLIAIHIFSFTKMWSLTPLKSCKVSTTTVLQLLPSSTGANSMDLTDSNVIITVLWWNLFFFINILVSLSSSWQRNAWISDHLF